VVQSMKNRIGRLVFLLALGLAWPAFSMNINIQEWKFDKDPAGAVPSGFSPGTVNADGGRWEVANDPKAPSPPNVLVRQATRPDQAQIIFIDGLEAGSLDLTLGIKAASASDGEGGGVIFRADDEHNYYVIWLSVQEKLLRLDKVVNGETKHVQDLTLDSVEPGKWHTLRLLIQGPLMEAIFNNRQYLSGREEMWAFGTYKKGKVGLWAKGAAPMYFDTVRYTDMDGSTTSSAPFGRESAAPKK
jgi:hypothetical protein